MHRFRRHSTAGRAVFLCTVLGLSLFFTVYSEITANAALDALVLCAESVVPSLFPFMVLSAIASRAASHLTGRNSARTAVILPVFLGALCGFPVGAAAVAGMYQGGAMGKQKAEYLCALCNNTGPAFVIGVIGRSFWGSEELGTVFYICQLLSAGIVFGIWRCIFCIRCKRFSADDYFGVSQPETPYSPHTVDLFCRRFCSSVADSAVAVVQICGYIVFFRVVLDTVRYLLPVSAAADMSYALLSAFLEFTSGASAAATIGGDFGVALCGFTIGFSGLSVMAQSTGILSKAGLSAAPLFRLKLIMGLVCGGLSLAAYRIFDFPEAAFSGIGTPHYSPSPIISAVIIAAAAVSLAVILLRQKSRV